jgi:cytoskeletal protein RodZ
MESFGPYLKSLREEAGKTLEEISESTKVAVANLEFMEKDRYDLLPPRVFVKGFIRSYVQELGLDAGDVVRKFEEYISEGELSDYAEEGHPVFRQVSPTHSFVHNKWFTIVLTAAGLLSLCILIITGVSRLIFSDEVAHVVQPSAVTSQAGSPVSLNSRMQAEKVSGKSFFADPPRKQAGKKILEIKALANTWVRVEPDAGATEELMMAPGDIQVFTANEVFNLQTGNAGGMRLRYDGRELPVLGKMNQSLSLTLP